MAARKAGSALRAGARVEVVSPQMDAALERLAATSGPRLRLLRRPYQRGDASGKAVVFACSDGADVQAAVAEEARRAGALLCLTDDPGGSDFIGGAEVRSGEVCVAVSTGGESPALAAHIAGRLEEVVGSHYAEAAALLGRLRRCLASECPSGGGSSRVFSELLEGGLVEFIAEGRRDELVSLLERVLGTDFELERIGIDSRG